MSIPSNYNKTCMLPACWAETSTYTHFCDDHAVYRGLEPALFEEDDAHVSGGRFHRSLSAVYVIGSLDFGAVKIGIARDVLDRVATLQTGFPLPLTIFSATYTSRKNAERIERECHKILKGLGLHMNGEWFDADPHDAGELVKRCADDLGMPVLTPGEYASLVEMSDFVMVKDRTAINRVRLAIRSGFVNEALDSAQNSDITGL